MDNKDLNNDAEIKIEVKKTNKNQVDFMNSLKKYGIDA